MKKKKKVTTIAKSPFKNGLGLVNYKMYPFSIRFNDRVHNMLLKLCELNPIDGPQGEKPAPKVRIIEELIEREFARHHRAA